MLQSEAKSDKNDKTKMARIVFPAILRYFENDCLHFVGFFEKI